MNRVKGCVLTLTADVPSGRDRQFAEWHMLEHMPTEFVNPGIVAAHRWRSTPACRAQRIIGRSSLDKVENLITYLMADPVAETFAAYREVNRILRETDQFPEGPSQWQFVGAYELLSARIASRIPITPYVLPWRPNLGVYLIAEKLAASQDLSGAFPPEDFQPILDVSGVAGTFCYGTAAALLQGPYEEGAFRMTVCYLDADPASVGKELRPLIHARWSDARIEPVFAGPFESLLRLDLDRFF